MECNACRFTLNKILLLLIALFLASCSQSPPEPIKLGLSINLSGRGGSAGEQIRDGAMLATREINDSGGIHGRPIELLVRDDENSEETIKKVDQELVDEGVVAIIGHSYSANTIIALPLVTSQDTLLITGYSASNKLSDMDDLFLRTSVDCTLYGVKTAKLLRKKGVKSLAVLMDMSNSGFVVDYVEHVRKNFSGSLHEVRFSSKEDADWEQITDLLLESRPDAVLFLTEATMTGVALQKLRNLNYAGHFLASIWVQTPTLLQYAGKAVEGLSIVTFINPQNPKPAYLDFAKKMKEQFDSAPTARSSRAYEIMMILRDALSRCENITAMELKKALLSKKYDTLMGNVEFDEFGDVVRPVYEVIVKEGRFQSLGEI
ncbi:MAG: ABC transporter substrate-binding protein [Desulfobulbaceae bacterium]|nr:ABC transporter substrate-binding protein [Desulfobulbaceae bacterium]